MSNNVFYVVRPLIERSPEVVKRIEKASLLLYSLDISADEYGNLLRELTDMLICAEAEAYKQGFSFALKLKNDGK